VPYAETRAATVHPWLESGGGGLFCTMENYDRFAQTFLNGSRPDGERILGRKTSELMSTDHLGPELRKIFQASHGRQKGYSYGIEMQIKCSFADAGLNIGLGE
jgi:CubicO group peptidase (beta-lactamase class C family)